MARVLNLFYAEPDPDRWLPGDRFARAFLRRILRGTPRIGGQQRVFLNLRAGLDRLNIPYRVNDFRYAQRNPSETVGIVGKPFMLDRIPWKNPIVFGAAVFSHASDCPDLLTRYPVRKVLVPGEWMRQMFEAYYGSAVQAWPVGIDTDLWQPTTGASKDIDLLVYDKVRWQHEKFADELITPIIQTIESAGLRWQTIRYGNYEEHDFHALLKRSRAMVFLCEHETQGIAYQQALSCGVPILAWDRGGCWQDPTYYPDRVQFAPVSSVPYWDERCGVRFADAREFPEKLGLFRELQANSRLTCRDYILENLTLERCAQLYVEHFDK